MSARKLSCAVGCLVVALFVLQAGIALADITIDVSTDVWIRQSNPSTTYEDDDIRVDNRSGVDSGQQRRGAIEFDLSGVAQKITGAYLKLYNYDWEGNDTAIVQTAFSMPKHNALSSICWNNMGTYTTGGVDFESFGAITLADAHAMGQYYSSSNASTADVAVLEALRTATDPNERKLSVLLLASSGGINWGDAANGYPVSQLVLNTVPEPSAVALLATALLGLLCYAWRKRK